MDIDTTVKSLPMNEQDAQRIVSEICAIPLLTYNIETLLAEKLQTILARGIANTGLRDYYDVYEIMKICAGRVDKVILYIGI